MSVTKLPIAPRGLRFAPDPPRGDRDHAPEGRVERRLAAILLADVAGYSRMVGADEHGTLVRWRAHWDELIEPTIGEHQGRVVRITGDGILAEFASVVNAARCALALQQGMARRNTGVAADERIEFRIGLNIGDVIIDRGDMWGEGVNVAARLEAMAEPGGLCVSGRVHDELANRLDVAFEDLGERHLKNIARPSIAHGSAWTRRRPACRQRVHRTSRSRVRAVPITARRLGRAPEHCLAAPRSRHSA
jgi:class 3 adenylate cyclase